MSLGKYGPHSESCASTLSSRSLVALFEGSVLNEALVLDPDRNIISFKVVQCADWFITFGSRR